MKYFIFNITSLSVVATLVQLAYYHKFDENLIAFGLY